MSLFMYCQKHWAREFYIWMFMPNKHKKVETWGVLIENTFNFNNYAKKTAQKLLRTSVVCPNEMDTLTKTKLTFCNGMVRPQCSQNQTMELTKFMKVP